MDSLLSSLGLSGLKFLNPALLGLLAFIPLLIFAYLQRKKLKPKIVSSLLILRSLKKHPISRRKFKPPFRFFLELLALLLLVLAVADPRIRQGGNTVAILLDNSLSMEALSSSNQTRFDLAKISLEKWLRQQRIDNSYTLFSASPSLQQHGTENITADELRSLIKKSELTVTADSLSNAVAELSETGTYDQVFVVSDKEPLYLPLSPDLSSRKETAVLTERVGAPVGNVFLSYFRQDQSSLSSQSSSSASSIKLLVGVSLSGAGPEEVEVQLSQVLKNNQQKPLLRRTLTLLPEKNMEVEFELPTSFLPGMTLETKVSPLQKNAPNGIRADDRARLTLGEQKGSLALLITEEKSSLGLQELFLLQTVSPTEFRSLPEERLKKYSLLIFHRTAPLSVPHVPLLLIAPPQNSIFPIHGEEKNPAVTSWAEEHPVTAYLRMPLLAVPASVVFSPPSWGESIINTQYGSLVVTGESQGVRFAGVGFELLPFEGAKTPFLSILTLNLTRWLEGEQERSLLPTTQEKTEKKERLDTVVGKDLPTQFFPEESRTYERGSFQTPKRVFHQQQQINREFAWWQYLVFFVVVVLCFELFWRLLGSLREKRLLTT